MYFFKKFLCLIALGAQILLYAEVNDSVAELNIGGSVRYTYNYSSWKDGQKARGGDWGFDVFKLNVTSKYKGISLNADFRHYSEAFGGSIIKQGWLGYDFNSEDDIQLGLTQVPFGITGYNSHSWFFSMNYYIGLEDDHDMGIKYTHRGSKFQYAIAFFKNAEDFQMGNNSDVSGSRYGYDVASIDYDKDGKLDFRNKEINQLNGQFNYLLGSKNNQHKIGGSAQFGGLYNLETEQSGSRYAIAGHYEANIGNFNVKAQVSKYKFSPENPEDENDDLIAMTAYGSPYTVAAEATSYTIGLAYTVPLKIGPLSSIQFYNDFGYLEKAVAAFEASMMNVTGMLVTAGSVYTYIDCGLGKNQPWIGPEWTDGLGQVKAESDWEMRFNINMGYYF